MSPHFAMLLAIPIALASAALPQPPPLKFGPNLLASFANDSFEFEASSLVRLHNDAGFVITAAVESPKGVQIPGIVDAKDVAHRNTTARMGLILRLSSTGQVLWGRRTCALPRGESLRAAASPGGALFVAGARLVGGSDDSFLVLARYKLDGTEEYFRDDHGRGPKYAYRGIAVRGDNTVLLAASLGSGKLQNSAGGDGAQRGSVALVSAFQGNGSSSQMATITRSASGTVEKERLWAMALIGEDAYVLARREVAVNGVYSMSDTLYRIHANELARPPVAQKELPTRNGFRPKVGAGAGGVLVGQIAREGSKSSLVLTRLEAASLNPANFAGGNSSSLAQTIFSPSGGMERADSVLAKILNVPPGAAVVLSAQTGFGEMPDIPDEEGQFNQRPSVIDVSSGGSVSRTQTASSTRKLTAVDAVRIGNGTVVLATDTTDTGKHALYLAVAAGPPKPTSADPRAGSENQACIGVRSVVRGVGILQTIRSRGLRRQRHPLRSIRAALRLESGRVRVLCFAEHGSKVCVTPGHIVYVRGVARYMRDVCKVMACEEDLQEVVNFKSQCGDHIAVNEHLAISMHSADTDALHSGRTAGKVAEDECAQQRSNWVYWMASTL